MEPQPSSSDNKDEDKKADDKTKTTTTTTATETETTKEQVKDKKETEDAEKDDKKADAVDDDNADDDDKKEVSKESEDDDEKKKKEVKEEAGEVDNDGGDDEVDEKKDTPATTTATATAAATTKDKKELSLVEQAELAELDSSSGPAPPDAVRPKNNDILFGRGKPFQNHPGNRKMLQLIDRYKQQYSESPRDRKRPIVEEIIGLLSQDGGRFLKRYNEDVNSTWWVEVSNQIAFDKVRYVSLFVCVYACMYLGG
jgi:hypothetical protein